MNKQRRERIALLCAKLEEIKSELETLQIAEQDAFENTPEGLQQSEKGQKSEEAASTLEDQASELENIITNLQEL